MTINRVRRWLDEPDEVQLDYWVMRTSAGTFLLPGAEARRVARVLQRWFVPRWLVFCDLSGSEARVRSGEVTMLCECTRAQREYDRRLGEALERERGDGEGWMA